MDKQRTILLIEDSPSQARCLQLVLQRAGYDVQIAGDGVQGWCQVCCKHPDLILLDINLPSIDGFGLLYLIRHYYMTATIPVVMLTVMNEASDREYAFELGANDYLCKHDCMPYSDGSHKIIDTVNSLFQRCT